MAENKTGIWCKKNVVAMEADAILSLSFSHVHE